MRGKMYLDKNAVPWEMIQKYYTNDYTYCFIRNVLTDEETCITDWALQKHFFEVPCVAK